MRVRSTRSNRRDLTPEKAAALVLAAEPVFRPILVTALHTGARRSEILQPCWKDIDFEAREVIIHGAPVNVGAIRGMMERA